VLISVQYVMYYNIMIDIERGPGWLNELGRWI